MRGAANNRWIDTLRRSKTHGRGRQFELLVLSKWRHEKHEKLATCSARCDVFGEKSTSGR